MRLESYLTENVSIDQWITPKQMHDILKKDCSKFIKEANGFFWRGIWGAQHGLSPSKIDYKSLTPRKDRVSKNTPPEVHHQFDIFFKDTFGWKARSEGAFATRELVHAQGYGNPWMFFPIGNYKYIYSEDIQDLYDEAEQLWYDVDAGRIESFNKQMRRMEYTDKNLKKSDVSEVMFKTDKYYAVNQHYYAHLGKIFGWKITGANIPTHMYKLAVENWGDPK